MERADAKQHSGRDRETVFVGYPVDTIDPKFHRSMLHLFAFDAMNKQRIVPRGVHLQMQTTNLPHGRNQIVKQFLESDCDWLWFVDTDQVFDPDVLERMLASADPVERPILGTLIFSYDVQSPGQPYFPTIYGVTEQGPVRWDTFPPNELVQCYATGTGCVLIHRSVLEAVGEKFGATSFPWFRYTEYVNADGEPDLISEDITFMARAGSCGFPVHVDTSIEVGHVKPHTVTSVQHFQHMLPSEEPAPTYVVIPVRGKQDITRSILRQLEEQGGFDHIFVYDNASDDMDAAMFGMVPEGVSVIRAAGLNIHEMWNLGVKEATNRDPRCNIAILNNDLELGPNFLAELARGLRAHPSIAAVSPNYDEREMAENVQPVKGICAGRYDGTGGLAGFAFMVRGEAFASGAIPMFDEELLYWWGDNVFTMSLDKIGATYGIVRDSTCIHIEGGSQTEQAYPDETNRMKAADRETFRRKYGAPGA